MNELTAIDNLIISIGNSLVQVVASTPVDPYNPLGLPPYTVRVLYVDGANSTSSKRLRRSYVNLSRKKRKNANET